MNIHNRVSLYFGQNVMFVCTVKPSIDLVAEIKFIRSSRSRNVTCGRFNQRLADCTPVGNKSNYNVSCGPGSMDMTSRIKKYMLNIQFLKEVDFTRWWCGSNYQKYHRNYLIVMEKRK